MSAATTPPISARIQDNSSGRPLLLAAILIPESASAYAESVRIGAEGCNMNPESALSDIVNALSNAESDEEEQQIGRGALASLLFHASPQLVDRVVKMARRDNRMRRCLAAARYYSGLKQETCDKIDAVLHVPFPAARRPGK